LREDTSGDGLSGSVDAKEIARFSALAGEWWAPEGKFKPLHALNPTRLAFIRRHLISHFGRDGNDRRPLEGLSVVDVGCGGGLLTEPMARLGAGVLGIDAGAEAIRVAGVHAAEGGLDIDYRCLTAEALAAEGHRFDAILNMEVIEHVADLDAFLGAVCTLLKPGGAMVVATLNRTAKAYALAIVGAEYVLGWLPPGTHDWRKFVTPAELTAKLAKGGVKIAETTGVIYNPLSDRWTLGRDLGVNYMAFAIKNPCAR
jgi:2-polyprenyl-6-hydroxyphenyl methylase/3-demethylubiquinone-9 3-methyltransferase